MGQRYRFKTVLCNTKYLVFLKKVLNGSLDLQAVACYPMLSSYFVFKMMQM